MADAMVTARMSQEKKEAGNRVLEQLGTNASQVVNRLYDYVLENKKLPFPEEPGAAEIHAGGDRRGDCLGGQHSSKGSLLHHDRR